MNMNNLNTMAHLNDRQQQFNREAQQHLLANMSKNEQSSTSFIKQASNLFATIKGQLTASEESLTSEQQIQSTIS